MTTDGVVQVFWTGGWDSTFRVLDLVLHQRAVVQPHYILAFDRQRYKAEMNAMARIRHGLDPRAAPRLLPTRITLLSDIPENDRIARVWNDIRSRQPLSSQYEWLTRYAHATGLTGIEIGFVKEGNAYFASDDLEPTMAENGSPSWRLPVDHGNPDWLLFEQFTFPIMEFTKTDLGHLSRERGFRELMEVTWFCQFPTRGQPCGYCRLCRDTMDQGMAYRFSLDGRIRHRFWKPFYLARVIRQNPSMVTDRLLDPERRFQVGEFLRDPRAHRR